MTTLIIIGMIWQTVGMAATVYYDIDRLSRMGIATVLFHVMVGSYLGPFLLIQPRC